ncbi:MAG: 30S ribosomal protein S15 [Alphaproteobacteria bacterium]|nr:30S ribosomal protein S15 [Alphaproteobacteria bacterium]
MSITKEAKLNLIKENRAGDKDTGSSAIQVAVLTERIKNLTVHLKEHKKDFDCELSLKKMVNRRKSLLAYIKSKSETQYTDLVKKLGLRK